MIDNYLLEELVTFAKEKTLARTAKQLNITQPTVTRGMQKLENKLGVQLFDRQPNRITLTKTGELAAREAARVIQMHQQFITRVRNFDQNQQVIKVASVAPGPLILTHSLAGNFNLKITPDFIATQQIIPSLTSHQYSLIFSNREIQTNNIESLYIGTERLNVNVDQFMYIANQASVTFKELHGMSFIVLHDIGPWKEIIQHNIPNAKFLYQTQVEALTEITHYSNFPYFTTNITSLSHQEHPEENDRVALPITDQTAAMPFYISYLKQNRQQISSLAKTIIKSWPN
ncbi:LysR family transcriptional regulator [Limosilactobacillus pontis]|uniref:LysR family transcriptional regulator n=1 Tax=Limosilactobacillus pontis TaxID=35787 RepID=A0A2J6NPF4_9LACO|nr:LysR family transcriptional regulator [Limosilactobacillus pontis]PMB83201.1 LysR family transcriptional regulator [Limosilactobacillus pontis]